MTKQELNTISEKLDTKRLEWGYSSKYQRAFDEGRNDVKSLLNLCENMSYNQVIDRLRKLLHNSPYLSGNKTLAYQMPIKSAMSMVSSARKEAEQA